jgi:hypothetical protein
MAQVKRKYPTAPKRARKPNMADIIERARGRVELPDVTMRYDYQDDVDTLVILFEEAVSPSFIRDDFEEGVIGIYKDKKLVGVEILDVTGGLAHANPT